MCWRYWRVGGRCAVGGGQPGSVGLTHTLSLWERTLGPTGPMIKLRSHQREQSWRERVGTGCLGHKVNSVWIEWPPPCPAWLECCKLSAAPWRATSDAFWNLHEKKGKNGKRRKNISRDFVLLGVSALGKWNFVSKNPDLKMEDCTNVWVYDSETVLNISQRP